MPDASFLFSRDNSTASPTASWHPSPSGDTRGTWDIITLCASTLAICVWNAVHMDIPLHDSKWNFVDRLGWLVVGIIAPDVLLYTACSQFHWACVVHRTARRCLDHPAEQKGWYAYLMHLLSWIGFYSKV